MPPDVGPMPKMSPEAAEAFRALVPDDERVTVRPMFGSLAAFVNGHLFAGLFGDGLFVRLDEPGRAEVHAAGGGTFGPMPGRPMREYASVADDWRADPTAARAWIARALELTSAKPPKPTVTKRRAKG
jgi:TfoX/Sxy family transcriptional regulator of competence genes